MENRRRILHGLKTPITIKFYNYGLSLYFKLFYITYIGISLLEKPDPKLVKWAFFLEFVFIAFRAPVVGADTWNYVRYLDGERNFYNYDPRPLEAGFVIYRQVLLALHPNRFVVMLVNSFYRVIHFT